MDGVLNWNNDARVLRVGERRDDILISALTDGGVSGDWLIWLGWRVSFGTAEELPGKMAGNRGMNGI